MGDDLTKYDELEMSLGSLETSINEAGDRFKALKAETAGLRLQATEAMLLLQEAIESEDFQPAYAQVNFMCGPALLGTLTRAFDALCPPKATTAEHEGEEDRDPDPLAYVEDWEQFEQQKSSADD